MKVNDYLDLYFCHHFCLNVSPIATSRLGSGKVIFAKDSRHPIHLLLEGVPGECVASMLLVPRFHVPSRRRPLLYSELDHLSEDEEKTTFLLFRLQKLSGKCSGPP
jgi:hypothetical protein